MSEVKLEISGWRISHKLAVVLLSTAVVSMLTIGSIYHLRSKDTMKELIYTHLQIVSSQILKQVKMAIAMNQERLELIASRTQLRYSLKAINEKTADTEHKKKLLRILLDAKHSINEIITLTVTDLQGAVIDSTNPFFKNTIMEINWLKEKEAAEAPLVIVKKNELRNTLLLAKHLVLEKERIGTILIEVDLSSFEYVLFNRDSQNSNEETILYYRDDDNVARPLILSQKLMYRQGKFNYSVSQLANKSTEGLITLSSDGGTKFLTINSKIPSLDWGLLIKIENDAAMRLIDEQELFLLYITLITSIILFLMTLFLGKKITKPIVDMTYAASLISKGDLTKRIQNLTHDELGLLGRVLNQMADNLINANLVLDKKVKEKTIELHQANDNLLELNNELEKLTLTDSLTRVGNRRAFNNLLEKEWKRCNRDMLPMSLLMVDVDFFKKYNDHLGHVNGDNCLVKVADILTQNIQRESDFVARYGGEEFIALLPNTTKEDCMNIAKQIIGSFEAAAIPHPSSDVSKYITVSIGVHTCQPAGSLDDSHFVELTDSALYKAKERGRNRAEAL